MIARRNGAVVVSMIQTARYTLMILREMLFERTVRALTGTCVLVPVGC